MCWERTPTPEWATSPSAAGVVRRTVYGHFPSRLDLVRTLTERAVTEVTAVLTESTPSDAEADAKWVDFIARVWRWRTGTECCWRCAVAEYGEAIHGLLGPCPMSCRRPRETGPGQRRVSHHHLPAGVLSQVAYGAVFAIADSEPVETGPSAPEQRRSRALLMLGSSRDARNRSRRRPALPCGSRAAAPSFHPSRTVLTVRQVFALSEAIHPGTAFSC